MKEAIEEVIDVDGIEPDELRDEDAATDEHHTEAEEQVFLMRFLPFACSAVEAHEICSVRKTMCRKRSWSASIQMSTLPGGTGFPEYLSSP